MVFKHQKPKTSRTTMLKRERKFKTKNRIRNTTTVRLCQIVDLPISFKIEGYEAYSSNTFKQRKWLTMKKKKKEFSHLEEGGVLTNDDTVKRSDQDKNHKQRPVHL